MIEKNCILSITKTIMRFHCSIQKIGYLSNDTPITSANKLRDFQCKFANVRMAMKHMSRTEKISNILIRHTFNCNPGKKLLEHLKGHTEITG